MSAARTPRRSATRWSGGAQHDDADVDTGELEQRSRRTRTSSAVKASASFPHAMRITRRRAGSGRACRWPADSAGRRRRRDAAADVAAGSSLPTIAHAVAPGGTALTGARAARGRAARGRAVRAARHDRERRPTSRTHGLDRCSCATARSCTSATPDRLTAKWAAAAAVLADSELGRRRLHRRQRPAAPGRGSACRTPSLARRSRASPRRSGATHGPGRNRALPADNLSYEGYARLANSRPDREFADLQRSLRT